MGVEIALPFSIRFSQKEMQIITGSLLFGKTIAIQNLAACGGTFSTGSTGLTGFFYFVYACLPAGRS